MMTGYLLDSNIFINANRHYRQAFFPIVWNFFQSRPEIYMLDRVYDEIVGLGDELSTWASAYYHDQALVADKYIAEYAEVVQYVSDQTKWTEAGSSQWTDDYKKADPWLIACAKHESFAIVTDENNTGPNGKATPNEPKIPFVAQGLGVRTINFWEFLGIEHFRA